MEDILIITLSIIMTVVAIQGVNKLNKTKR